MPSIPATRDIKLVAIGNSKGVRIPKDLRLKYGWGDELVLEECDEGIMLYARGTGKLSWDDTYRAMAKADEDWDDFDAAIADGLENAGEFRLRDASVSGIGLQEPYRNAGWATIRDTIYRGRGS